MRAKNRIRNRKGFTLAETMLAVLILVLVSSIVAAGMPAAKRAYEKVVLAGNSELLLSTAVSTLRDELGTAWDVQSATGGGVIYFSADTGNRSKLYVDAGTIKLMEYSETTTAEQLLIGSGEGTNPLPTLAPRDLVFLATDDTALKLTCESITLQGETVVISGLCVKNAEGTEMAKWEGALQIPVFSVRSIETT